MAGMADTPGAGGLTVGQVSARLDVTVRALHHWDEIGLARPSLRTAAGYRLYNPADLERLHAQRARIAERIARLQRLGAGLDRMIDAHERGPLLTAEQQAAVFGPGWDPDGPARARRRYGDTPQWRQYAERSASRTPEEWQAVADAVAELDRALGEAMDAGVTPGSPEADHLAERHREVFASYFPLTRQMQVCLARMYEADPGYAAHYDGIRPGLARWFRRVVDAAARAQGIDPSTATWCESP